MRVCIFLCICVCGQARMTIPIGMADRISAVHSDWYVCMFMSVWMCVCVLVIVEYNSVVLREFQTTLKGL